MKVNLALIILTQFIYISAFGQKEYNDSVLENEMKYRQNQVYRIEHYYKQGKLDSIFRRRNSTGKLITEGCYKSGLKHGQWIEWITNISNYSYIKLNYKHGKLLSLYELMAYGNNPDKKEHERFVNYTSAQDYIEKYIKWYNTGRKSETRIQKFRKNKAIEKKTKWWRKNGKPWEERLLKCAFDRSGKYLGQRKHGTWRLWNKDGTLQKETWYDMGQKLREKLYDHGKLTSDKKY